MRWRSGRAADAGACGWRCAAMRRAIAHRARWPHGHIRIVTAVCYAPPGGTRKKRQRTNAQGGRLPGFGCRSRTGGNNKNRARCALRAPPGPYSAKEARCVVWLMMVVVVVVVVVLHNKNPPTPCLWQAPASTQKTKRKTRPAICRVSHGTSFLAPGSLARRRSERLIHHHHQPGRPFVGAHGGGSIKKRKEVNKGPASSYENKGRAQG